MSLIIDPLNIFAIILMQLANRYLKIDLTKIQEKIVIHPITQLAMYGSVIYLTTRNILTTLIIIVATYVLVHILFNENHHLNILPPKLLNKDITSAKELYKNNITVYHG